MHITAGIRCSGTNVKMTALTVNSSCTFFLYGKGFEFTNPSTSPTNNGTIRLNGDEALTNVANLDITAGTVEYAGNEDEEPITYTIKDFGATDYNNLTLFEDGLEGDTYDLGNDLS